MNKLKIGIKYCGGCNPEYDRVALVKYIEKRLQNKADFLSPESEDLDLILAIQGCGTTCADLTHFQGRLVYIIKSRKDADTFLKSIDSVSIPKLYS
ncbi:MAG: hypothetical protein JRF71_08510 [Deltaproteobacteria bacterium]|nr:hypothetical protein [Deltaproteobacteria bacterium]